jgi:hypothetical protein
MTSFRFGHTARQWRFLTDANLERDVRLASIIARLRRDFPEARNGVTFEAFDRALADGIALELVACLITPADVDDSAWGAAISTETVAWLRRLTCHEGKARLLAFLVGAVRGAFYADDPVIPRVIDALEMLLRKHDEEWCHVERGRALRTDFLN